MKPYDAINGLAERISARLEIHDDLVERFVAKASKARSGDQRRLGLLPTEEDGLPPLTVTAQLMTC